MRMSPPSGGRGEAERDDGAHRPERAAAHPGGNAAVTIAGPIAIIALAPSAWTTRAATSPPSAGRGRRRRARGEHVEAARIERALAEPIAETSEQDERGGDREYAFTTHCSGPTAPKLARERRQRDVHDVAVERRHDGADGDDGEREPALKCAGAGEVEGRGSRGRPSTPRRLRRRYARDERPLVFEPGSGRAHGHRSLRRRREQRRVLREDGPA